MKIERKDIKVLTGFPMFYTSIVENGSDPDTGRTFKIGMSINYDALYLFTNSRTARGPVAVNYSLSMMDVYQAFAGAALRPDAPERPITEKPDDMKMYDFIRERSALAHTYAEDGAYGSAALILTDLGLAVTRHAEEVAEMMAEVESVSRQAKETMSKAMRGESE